MKTTIKMMVGNDCRSLVQIMAARSKVPIYNHDTQYNNWRGDINVPSICTKTISIDPEDLENFLVENGYGTKDLHDLPSANKELVVKLLTNAFVETAIKFTPNPLSIMIHFDEKFPNAHVFESQRKFNSNSTSTPTPDLVPTLHRSKSKPTPPSTPASPIKPKSPQPQPEQRQLQRQAVKQQSDAVDEDEKKKLLQRKKQQEQRQPYYRQQNWWEKGDGLSRQ